MSFKIGEAVRWTSSYMPKEGVIEAIVPRKTHPRDMGYPKIGAGSGYRDSESYIVRGGEPGKPKKSYWPVVSLLHAKKGLTADEIAWCQANAARIRALIAQG